MEALWLVVAALQCTIVTAQSGDNSSTLKFVHAVWRHGDRSPESHWPTDTFNSEASWPQGWGELTIAGMQQQFALGRYLMNRYDGFISPQYDKYQVYIRATSYNRTIMSAQANLAGMFPPDSTQTWNKQLPWQPVPVHTVEKWDDPFLADCPNFDSEMLRVRSFPVPARVDAENRDFYAFLSEKTGVSISYLDKLWNAWDPIRCLEAHSTDTTSGTHRMPEWVNDTVIERVKVKNIHKCISQPIKYRVRFPYGPNIIQKSKASLKRSVTMPFITT